MNKELQEIKDKYEQDITNCNYGYSCGKQEAFNKMFEDIDELIK